MIVKIDADFIKNLKNFIANNPVNQVVLDDEGVYKYPCMLSIGNELLWEGHKSGDWIVDRNPVYGLEGSKHKECTTCGKTLETEKIPVPDEVYEQYFTFYLSSNSCSIEAKEGVTLVEEIYLPSSYKGKPVTHIEAEAFKGRDIITKVTIPNSVISIGSQAFQDCTKLASVTFEANSQLESIGMEAFDNCNKLAFVEIPDSVTYINAYAFYGCDILTDVVIGLGVETIERGAFNYCNNLTNIYYRGNSETQWNLIAINGNNDYLKNTTRYYYTETRPSEEGNYWHWDKGGKPVLWCYHKEIAIIEAVAPTCTETGLTEGSRCTICGEIVTAQEVIPALGHKWSQWELDETTWTWHRECETCGEYESNPNLLAFVLLDDGTYSVGVSEGAEGDIAIPSTYKGKAVTTIGDYAFADCYSLESVTIPDSVTDIGDAAFRGCDNLTSMVIPDSVTDIGDNAFRGCDNLASVVIGNSVTYIWHDAFRDCKSLTSVVIPDSVIEISEGVFEGCTNLSSVTFGNSLSIINYYAFFGCEALTSIILPDSVTYIAEWAFTDCINLSSITLGNGIKYIGFGSGDKVFDNTAYYNNPDNWVDGMLYIGDYLIAVKNTKTYVKVASSCSSISAGITNGWTHAAAIKIPLNVMHIQPKAFVEAENVTIYCEAPSKPDGWADDWCDGSVTVVWGYVEDTSFYILTEDGEKLTDEQGDALLIEGVDISTFILTENGEFLTDKQGDILMIEGD